MWPIWDILHCSLQGRFYPSMLLYLNWSSPFYPILLAPLRASNLFSLKRCQVYGALRSWCFFVVPFAVGVAGSKVLCLFNFCGVEGVGKNLSKHEGVACNSPQFFVRA